jgi:hypothetical protein
MAVPLGLRYILAASQLQRLSHRAAVVSGGLGVSYATFYPSRLARVMNYPDAPAPLPADSPEGIAAMQAIDAQLQSLPLVQRLRAEMEVTQSANSTTLIGDSAVPLQQQRRWLESRPYQNYPAQKLKHHLTAGTLRGPSKLAIKPLVFSTRDETESYIILHLGRSLCGHDGIVHGGLLATVMDETLGRTVCALPFRQMMLNLLQALLNLPAKLGVTAYLHVRCSCPPLVCQLNAFNSSIIRHRLSQTNSLWCIRG